MDPSRAQNCCLRFGCIKCCLNTEMPLTNSDVLRITRLGFPRDFFVAEKSGEWTLRNSKGRCVFHDGSFCTIYHRRPQGCTLYPVVLDAERGEVVLDSVCPHQAIFQISPSTSRRVLRLIMKLNTERDARLRGAKPNTKHKR